MFQPPYQTTQPKVTDDKISAIGKNMELYKIWKSNTNRTYNTYNPHITIYDNDNTSFSKELFNILKNIGSVGFLTS